MKNLSLPVNFKFLNLKYLNFTIFSFLLSPFFLNAQQGQLPDSSFENGWIEKNDVNGPYWEYKTTYFYTLNSLFALENSQRPASITAIRDGVNAQHGQYSIKLVSGDVPVGDMVFLPGMVGTISQNFVNEFIDGDGNVTMTKEWDGYETPTALEGYYKYHPANGDSALIDIGFTGNGKDFVEKIIVKERVEEWRKFSLPIPKQYWDEYFETIRVLFVASAGVRFDSLQLCKGQLGSTLWVDNISLVYNKTGIKQDLLSTLKANAFPNPATEVLNIELNENFIGKVTVYNMSGSMIMEEKINGTQCRINTSNFATGNYLYKFMYENTIFAQGKFMVTR
jgi:hypothetical protein